MARLVAGEGAGRAGRGDFGYDVGLVRAIFRACRRMQLSEQEIAAMVEGGCPVLKRMGIPTPAVGDAARAGGAVEADDAAEAAGELGAGTEAEVGGEPDAQVELKPGVVAGGGDRGGHGVAPGHTRRAIYITVGLVSIALGGVGAFVPLLPTTGFLVLASWCFTRSCPWLEDRLIHANPIFRPFTRYLLPGATMPMRARLITLALMWSAIVISTVAVADRAHWGVLVVVALSGVVGSLFIWRFARPGPTVVGAQGSTAG